MPANVFERKAESEWKLGLVEFGAAYLRNEVRQEMVG